MADAADDAVQFVPAGKLRCYVTGILRRDTPEEHVRQRWARSLVEEYGYSISDIAVEFPIKMGSRSKSADLVVFHAGTPHKQENVLIVIEAKRADALPQQRQNGIEQLKSYMAACSRCQYGLWVGSEKVAFSRSAEGVIVDSIDIPRAGDDQPRVPEFVDLIPALDLKATLHRCHNYIYANQGLQKAEAFHELVKLIFAKVYDETESVGLLRFFVRSDERRSTAGQQRLARERIAPLFAAVRERYQYIFDSSDSVQLNDRVLAYIVSELQAYSLLRTQTDVKGAAYEELVGANLRGDRGEYFTPRNVCDMALSMVFSLYNSQQLTSLRILDTCCGTGGFLVSAINYYRRMLTDRETERGGSSDEVVERVNTRVRDVATRQIYGTDINPFLVQTCQMNLVMHGDGSANVFQADTLYSPGEWTDSDAAARIRHGSFDIVVTNPPFGSNALVDDPHVLDQYELSSFGGSAQRQSLPPEQLFVEAAWRFLKPSGYMAIVLPDSILNNPSLAFIRRWLLQRAKIIASIDLPKETFAESRGVPNPSLLIIQRLTEEESRLAEKGALDAYEIFMAIPKFAGIDKRGQPIYRQNADGMDLIGDGFERQRNDDLPLVAEQFQQWAKGGL